MQIIHRVAVMQVLTERSKESFASLPKRNKCLNENATSSIFSLENMRKNSKTQI